MPKMWLSMIWRIAEASSLASVTIFVVLTGSAWHSMQA